MNEGREQMSNRTNEARQGEFVERLQQLAADDALLNRLAHEIACVELGLDPNVTMFGGDERDVAARPDKLVIIEDDPRYEKYWMTVGVVYLRGYGMAIGMNVHWMH